MERFQRKTLSQHIRSGISRQISAYVDNLYGFRESTDFTLQVENYRNRYRYYPESIHADKIYLTRENRRLCREKYHCRLTGKLLERPREESEENKERITGSEKAAKSSGLY